MPYSAAPISEHPGRSHSLDTPRIYIGTGQDRGFACRGTGRATTDRRVSVAAERPPATCSTSALPPMRSGTVEVGDKGLEPPTPAV